FPRLPCCSVAWGLLIHRQSVTVCGRLLDLARVFMAFPVDSSLTSVKVNVAGLLRKEMITDRLKPGEPIVEGKWAAKLKVARASVREAINILAAEGFVQKGLARTARVTAFSLEDVVQIYDTRVALEGMA